MLVHVHARHAWPGCGSAEAHLATSLVVREDSLTLFGFADDDEREVFELVQTVSGVGPRLALAMLAVHAPTRCAARSRPRTSGAHQRCPASARKGAAAHRARAASDRIGVPAGATGAAPRRPPPAAAWRDQVREAWSGSAGRPSEADDAVDAVAAEAGRPQRRPGAAAGRPAELGRA